MKTYFVACSPHKDIPLGNWKLPKGKVALVNSGISHMDQTFWNTKDGEYPVHRFWPERFITHVHDPASGPMKPAMQRGAQSTTTERVQDDKGTFSLDGLQGLWIPYGGQYYRSHLQSIEDNKMFRGLCNLPGTIPGEECYYLVSCTYCRSI